MPATAPTRRSVRVRVGPDECGGRPDVAAIYGAQFEAAGFTLTVPSLAPGVYDLLVYPWSHTTGRFEAARAVRVSVK